MGDAEVIHIQALPLDPHREDFRIDSLSKADWALEVLAASEARKAENKALAAEAHRRADAWLEKVNGQEERDTAFVRAQLDAFMSAQRPLILGGKTAKKSRSLPHGVLGWKAKPRRLLFDDDARTLAWARSRPIDQGLWRSKPELNRDAVKAVAEREKIIPPGTKWDEASGEDVPFVKPLVPSLPTSKGDEP